MKNLKPFAQIKLLNEINRSSNAKIVAKAKPSESEYGSQYEIEITDCSDTAVLHGNLATMESRRNAIYKLRTLRKTVKALENHLLAEFKRLKVDYK